MYSDRRTFCGVELLTEHLSASSPRPFPRVFTVVSKLFNIVLPDVAVFGQKDIQQAVSLEKMEADLNFPLKIVISPTVREDDGLAMSSRNMHLDATERRRALCIHQSLRRAEEITTSGERSAGTILHEVEKALAAGEPDKIDYASLVRYSDLPARRHPLRQERPCRGGLFRIYATDRQHDNNERDGKFSCVY
jgi:pantoate--beta-alanine ligase